MLNLISLRFPGGQSTIEVLNLCRSISIKSLQRIATWDETDQDVQLLYASNVILISIAFSAVFLLKVGPPSRCSGRPSTSLRLTRCSTRNSWPTCSTRARRRSCRSAACTSSPSSSESASTERAGACLRSTLPTDLVGGEID